MRTNPIKEELRQEVYSMLEGSMGVAGINAAHCDPFHDRGDGVLALVHPVDNVPKTLLLNPLVPVPWRLLADRNQGLPGPEQGRRQLRLRVVVHAGEVHCDGRGHFGEALDVAFRLSKGHGGSKAFAALAGSLVLAAALGAARAATVHLWVQDGQPWRKGTWLTGALWVLSLAAHFGLDYLLDPHSPDGGVGGASILLYLAITYTVQRLIVQARAQRIPAGDTSAQSRSAGQPR